MILGTRAASSLLLETGLEVLVTTLALSNEFEDGDDNKSSCRDFVLFCKDRDEILLLVALLAVRAFEEAVRVVREVVAGKVAVISLDDDIGKTVELDVLLNEGRLLKLEID
jgi:hypothetical protein